MASSLGEVRTGGTVKVDILLPLLFSSSFPSFPSTTKLKSHRAFLLIPLPREWIESENKNHPKAKWWQEGRTDGKLVFFFSWKGGSFSTPSAHAPMAFRAMLLSFNGYKLIFCAFKLSPTSFSCVWPTKARPHFETSLLSRSNLPKPIPAPSQRACFCIFLFSSSGGVFGRLPNSFPFFLGRFQLPNFSDQKKKTTQFEKPHFVVLFRNTPVDNRNRQSKVWMRLLRSNFQRSIRPSTSFLQVGFSLISCLRCDPWLYLILKYDAAFSMHYTCRSFRRPSALLDSVLFTGVTRTCQRTYHMNSQTSTWLTQETYPKSRHETRRFFFFWFRTRTAGSRK